MGSRARYRNVGAVVAACGLAAGLLTGCQTNLDRPGSLSREQVQQALAVSTITMLPQDEMPWACGVIHDYAGWRDSGCISIAEGHARIYLSADVPEWLQETERLHYLGHAWHRIVDGGGLRGAQTHAYANALDALKARVSDRAEQRSPASPRP